MKKMKKPYELLFFLLLALSPISAYCEEDDLPPTDDPPLAPIDNGVIGCLIVGVLLAFVIFHKYNFRKIENQTSAKN